MREAEAKRKAGRAEMICKGLLTLLLIVSELAIWPGYLVHNAYLSSSYSEYAVYSEPITEETQITQYFQPLYSRLDQIEFALGFVQEAAGDQKLSFGLYDEKGTEMLSQEIPLQDMTAEHYYTIPIEKRLSTKKMYHWTLTVPENSGCDICFMYGEHGNGMAPENIRLERNGDLFGADDAQATARYSYEIHPDKIVIIGGYWMGNALIYLLLMEVLDRAFKYRGQRRKTADEASD